MKNIIGKIRELLFDEAPGQASSKRLANIQALRGLSAILVVGVHVQASEAKYSADQVLSPWLYYGVSGVDIFFVISGFIMVYISKNRFGSPRNVGLFLYDRVARIYPPAILFTALAVLGMLVMGTTEKWLPGNNVLFSFLLIPQVLPPLLGVSWTLIHELYFYLVFAIMLLGRFRLLPLWLALWGLGILIAQYNGMWRMGPWTDIIFHPLTFEFILGAGIGLIVLNMKLRGGLLAVIFGIFLFILGLFMLGTPDEPSFPIGWGRVMAFAPGAGLILYGVFTLEAKGQWCAPRFITVLGNWSFSLYLSHMLVISVIAHIWALFERPGIVDNLVFIVVSFVSTLTFAALAYYGFERPILRLTKKLGAVPDNAD